MYVLGDYNANLRINSNKQISPRFGKELKEFCKTENLILSDVLNLPPDTYTFISSAHGTVSWLDHIVTTKNGHERILDITVDNSFVTSDHLPVRMELDFLCAHKMQSLKLNKKRTILWSTLTPVDIREYSTKSEDLLSRISISDIKCDKSNCNDVAHRQSLTLCTGK